MPLTDPFDLPEWLGEREVVWQALESVVDADTVRGELADPADEQDPVRLDLLVVDRAWPQPVCDEPDRRAAHQAWHYGEVALLDRDGTCTLGVPGSAFTADLVAEAVRRFSRAVGAKPSNYAVRLRL